MFCKHLHHYATPKTHSCAEYKILYSAHEWNTNNKKMEAGRLELPKHACKTYILPVKLRPSSFLLFTNKKNNTTLSALKSKPDSSAVEQWLEKPLVGGSNPPLGKSTPKKIQSHLAELVDAKDLKSLP
jgi:hypothetical protein